MEKLRSLTKYLRNGQFLTVASIFVLSLLTFNILFDASAPDDYPRELLAALIGTIMAAVVTTILLNQQSVGEEVKERNVEIFRKKISAYENFIDRALLHADDGLSNDEVRELRRAIYVLSLVSNSETVGELIRYVRANHVGDMDCDISVVIAAFRKELRLDELNESTLGDLEAIEAKLSGDLNPDKVDLAAATFNKLTNELLFELTDKASATFESTQLIEASGLGDGLFGYMSFPSGADCNFFLPYDTPGLTIVEGQLDLDAIAAKPRERVLKLAASLGLKFDAEIPNTPLFMLSGSMDKQLEHAKESDLGPVLSVPELSDILIALERAAQASVT